MNDSFTLTEAGVAAARHALAQFQDGKSVEAIAADLQLPVEALQLLIALANHQGEI